MPIRQANTIYYFKSRYLKQHPRPKTNRLYYLGKRTPAIIHAKMCIGCSPLNYDLHFNLHVIADPNYGCIMAVHETADHFFTTCPWYTAQRIPLYAGLFNIANLSPISIDLLLNGDGTLADHSNLQIFNLVHNFITETHRFDFN